MDTCRTCVMSGEVMSHVDACWGVSHVIQVTSWQRWQHVASCPTSHESQYFEGVLPQVWNFHIGGYQVCQKWLKDRKGRTLTFDDLTHYQKVVAPLKETVRLTGKIDSPFPMGHWDSRGYGSNQTIGRIVQFTRPADFLPCRYPIARVRWGLWKKADFSSRKRRHG